MPSEPKQCSFVVLCLISLKHIAPNTSRFEFTTWPWGCHSSILGRETSTPESINSLKPCPFIFMSNSD